MKSYILILTVFFCVSCAGKPAADNAASTTSNVVNEQVREKNKLTAAKNEVTEITRIAQTLEQQGRDMQSYRESSGAESARQCSLILEDRRKGVTDLEERINKLPEAYKNKLSPIIGELNECISCAKKGLDDCKKARASINGLIKELF